MGLIESFLDRRRRKRESPEEREERERQEWLRTSDNPQAVRHRKYDGMEPDDMLLEVAAQHSAEGRGYCWTTDAEFDALYPLYQRGLIAKSRHQGFVVHLTDAGRRVVSGLLDVRGLAHTCCRHCGHGEYQHKGTYPVAGENEKPWLHHDKCEVPDCGCSGFAPDREEISHGI